MEPGCGPQRLQHGSPLGPVFGPGGIPIDVQLGLAFDTRHLHGLEQHGCIRKELGWQSCPLGLYRNGKLLAAAPLYLKDNSHGEFVFDWAWASSYARLGMDYYPKLLAAVPYSPVSGPRLLAGHSDDAHALRQTLVETIERCTGHLQLSSAHLNFVSESDTAALAGSARLPRFDCLDHPARRWPPLAPPLPSRTCR